jgi:hypothetical protein
MWKTRTLLIKKVSQNIKKTILIFFFKSNRFLILDFIELGQILK